MEKFYQPDKVPSPEEQRERYLRKPDEVIQEVLDTGVDEMVRDLYPKFALDPENEEQYIAGMITLLISAQVYGLRPGGEERIAFFDRPKWKEVTALIEDEVHELEGKRKSIVAAYEARADKRNAEQ